MHVSEKRGYREMRLVRLTDIKKISKWALPAGIVAVGLGVVVAQSVPRGAAKTAATEVSTTDVQTHGLESPAATVEPDVVVNGTKIPTNKKGSTSVNIPGGKAQVEVSDGHTSVTTQQNGSSSGSNQSSSSVNINLNSHTTTSSSGNSGSSYTNTFSSTNSSSVNH